MALSRQFLKSLEIDSDVIDKIINEHRETVDALKEQRDNLEEKANKYDDTLKAFKEYKAEHNADEDFKTKYNEEHKAFEDFKKNIETEKQTELVKTAYRKLLTDNKVGEKHIDSILKVTDFSDIKLDEKGELVNADTLTKSIKDDWSGFITSETKEGSGAGNPPKGGATMTKADIMKITDTAERQKAIMEHSELFS